MQSGGQRRKVQAAAEHGVCRQGTSRLQRKDRSQVVAHSSLRELGCDAGSAPHIGCSACRPGFLVRRQQAMCVRVPPMWECVSYDRHPKEASNSFVCCTDVRQEKVIFDSLVICRCMRWHGVVSKKGRASFARVHIAFSFLNRNSL